MHQVKFSLKSKLILLFLFLSLVPFVTALVFMYHMSAKELDSMTDKRLTSSASMVNYFLDQKASEAMSLAERYLQNDEMIKAFEDKDREKLLDIILPIYETLSQDAHITVFELGDESGSVFARAHSKEKYGDSKADNSSIKAALSGQQVKGLEFGKSGLAIRAFLPIKSGDNVIGTFQVGFDDTILSDIQASINGNISLYNGNKLVKTSSETEQKNIGSELSNPSVYPKVQAGQMVKVKTNTKEMVMYYPLYDTLGKSVEGMIAISQDISDIERYRTTSLYTSLILLLFLTVAVTVISYLFAINITTPINKAVTLINQIAKFDLSDNNCSQLIRRRDEIGVIARSISDMQNSLRTMIGEMAKISRTITTSSKELFVSAEENTRTIHQVTIAISEIATGSESLSKTVNEESNLIEEVTDSIEAIATIVSENSVQAVSSLEAVAKGQLALNQTQAHVEKSIVTATKANTSIQELVEMIEQVSNISNVISSISSQTNLLALNAAIEAARAGEAGKGFSVVAEEIRKLSEETSTSLKQIDDMIKKTVSLANEAGISMHYTHQIAKEQKQSVDITKEAFETIDSYAKNIAQQTKETAFMLTAVENTSKQIHTHTMNTAAIAEESAAGSEEISASGQEQLTAVETIAKAASSLSAMAESLNEHIVNFRL